MKISHLKQKLALTAAYVALVAVWWTLRLVVARLLHPAGGSADMDIHQ